MDLEGNLGRTDFRVIIPPAVAEEIDHSGKKSGLEVKELKGRSLKKVEELVRNVKIGRGEAECLALAKREGLNFLVSDDRKLIRQKSLSREKYLRDIKILGFSFFLHLFEKKDLIKSGDLWDLFDQIIEANNWERSEVYVTNYTFLSELGY